MSNKINNNIIIWYLSRNMELFPLRGVSKVPLESGWQTNEYSYNDMFLYASNGNNVGWRLGPCDVVFDVDPRQGGDKSLARLKADIGLDLDETTCIVATGGGGWHYYYTKPEILKFRSLPEYPGIDIKRQGGYVVIAGSGHESGNFYSFANDLDVALIPPQLASHYGKATHIHRELDPNTLTPDELDSVLVLLNPENYSNNDSWFPLLAASCNATQGNEEAREIFVEWSIRDSKYADDSEIIRNRWDSVAATAHLQDDIRHIGTLVHELKKHDVVLPECIVNKGRPDFKIEALQSIDDVIAAISFIPEDSSDRELKFLADEIVRLSKDEEEKNRVFDMLEDALGRDTYVLRKASGMSGCSENLGLFYAQPTLDFAQRVALATIDNYFGGGQNIVRGADETFWKYGGTHWAKLNKDVLRQAIILISDRTRGNDAVRINTDAVLRQTYNLMQGYCANEEGVFFMNTNLKSCINTLTCEIWLDPSTGKRTLQEHSPASYLTTVLPVEYDPDSTCPIFDNALRDIFSAEENPEDMIRHIWEIFGYTMQPKKNIASWFLFHGKGANGKTFLLRVLSAMLGKAVLDKAVDSFNIRSNKHAYFDLVGKLALIDEDVKSQIFLPDDFLKHFSETKTLSATEHYKAAQEYQMNVTCLMAANSWPSSKDLSHGMLRRAYIVPFKKTFTKEEMDIDLFDKVAKLELSGILNRAIDGLTRLRKRGNFKEPRPCIEAKSEWLTNANQAAEFINDCYEERAGRSIKLTDVFTTYNNWKSIQGVSGGYHYKAFRAALENMGIDISKGSGGYICMKNYIRKTSDVDV